MSNRLEIHGQQFGLLTAIRPAGNNPWGQALWECVCECGRTKVIAACNLKSGKTRSCGCLSRRGRDLAGQKFGKLTAIQRVEDDGTVKNPNRSALWLCRCECGREKVMKSNSLLTGNSQSCGDCSFGEYELADDHVIGHFENGYTLLIDSGDYERVSERRWWLDRGSGYFCSTENGRMIYLHRFLLPDREGLVCDHINRDKTDNRRCNLRYATPRQNSRNRSMGRNNTSGYIGVSWHIRQKKFVAGIKVNGRTVNLGSFDNVEDAARARDKAALRFFGSFANLNFGGNHEQVDARTGESIHAAHIAV